MSKQITKIKSLLTPLFKKKSQKVALQPDIIKPEDEKEGRFNKKYVFSGILILLLITIVLSNLSLIPLTNYKKNIEKQFKELGIIINIRGGVNLNIFSLRYEIKDVAIYKKDSSSSFIKCQSSLEGIIPFIYVSFLTGKVTIIDSHFIISTNNNTVELFNFIKQQKIDQNISLVIKNSEINLELCDVISYAGSSQGDSDSKKSNTDNKSLLIPQPNIPQKDTTVSYSVNLATIKNIEIELSKNYKEIDASLLVNKTDINTKFKKTQNSTKFSISSESLNANFYIDYSKVNKKGIIGSYNVESDDIGKFIKLLLGSNNNFISNVFNKTYININSDISADNGTITSSATIKTSYGNGEISTVHENNTNPKIAINFDKISTDSYEAIANNKQNYNFITLGEFIISELFKIDYNLNLSVKKITHNITPMGDISLNYDIKQGKILVNNFSASILGLDDQNQGQITLFEDTASITPSNEKYSKIKIKVEGQNFSPFLYLMQNIFLANTETFDIKNSSFQQKPYQGYAEYIFDFEGSTGLNDFNITYGDNQKIQGYYLLKQPTESNDYLFSGNNISLSLLNINLDDILTNKAQQRIWRYFARLRGISSSDIEMQNEILLKTIVQYTNYNAPLNVNIILNNTIFNQYPASGIINFQYKNNTLQLNADIQDSSILKGSLYFSVDTRRIVPILQFKAGLDVFNIKELDNFLYKIYDTRQLNNSTFNYLKRQIILPNMNSINSDITFEAKILNGNVFNITNFIAYLQGSGNIFNVDRISGEIQQGNFLFSGEMKNKHNFEHSLTFKFTDLDLDFLLTNFINIPNLASGKLLIDGSLTSAGNNIYDILSDSIGRMIIKINNMHWNKLDLVSLSKALMTSSKYGKIDINQTLQNGTQMFFKDVTGEFILQNGILSTNGLSSKAEGVSSVLKISLDLLNNELRSLENNFLILAKDPRPDKNYLSIPIALKASGSFSHINAQIYVDRVQEYLNSMYKYELNDYK